MLLHGRLGRGASTLSPVAETSTDVTGFTGTGGRIRITCVPVGEEKAIGNLDSERKQRAEDPREAKYTGTRRLDETAPIRDVVGIHKPRSAP
jgi:hypothetical protein